MTQNPRMESVLRHRWLTGWWLATMAFLALCAVACGDNVVEPVPNQAPVVTGAIPAQTVVVGDSVAIDLSAHFSDPDLDALSFSVETSAEGVVTASVAGDTLTAAAVAQGEVEVAVTAHDPGGLSASQTFSVTVPNQAPRLTDSIPALELVTGDAVAIDLSAHFSDPDLDALSFSVETSAEGVVTASVAGDTLTAAAVAQGEVEVAVTAHDPGGLSASQTFSVTVPNQAPRLTDSIPALELVTGDAVAIDLSAHFSDPDLDALSFSVETSAEGVVTASVAGDTLTAAAVAQGEVEVAVTAHDPGGLSASQTFSVTVPNQAPRLTDSLPRLPLLKGAVVAIDLSAHFSDPEGLPLRFSVESSDADVATASVSRSTLTVTAFSAGTATITVTVQDSGDLSVSESFGVTVPANPDRAALVAIYEAMGGPNWARSHNWLSDAPLGSWQDVVAVSGRVTSLDLTSNRLHGRIPPEVVFLAKLQHLVLADNNLSGPIPPELDRLTALERLILKGNNLTGPIPPELGSLTKLTRLNLHSNRLSGPIPPELDSLTALELLELGTNNLSGPIPPELGSLTALEHLELGTNNLSGPIPPELGSLTKLTRLDLGSNRLSGPIPPELDRLTALERLILKGNNLSGPIPPELGSLTKLTRLNLGSNRFSGSILPELGGLTKLARLELHSNRLTGSIPPELGRLSELTDLWLRHNDLTGLIPPELGNLSSLKRLLLNSNRLRGSVPPSFLQLGGLKWLFTDDNDGLCVPGVDDFVAWLEDIPVVREQPYCNESDMRGLAALYESTGGKDWINSEGWLGGAALDGWYGVVADSLGRLLHLDLARNGLVGPLPAALGHLLDQATELRLDGNDLSGPLPLSLGGLPLKVLHYMDTDLCFPPDESFQAWLNTIPSHQSTGVQCLPLSDRDILVKLYEATGGPNWVNRANWSTDASLGSWHGVRVDQDGRVTHLDLGNNRLTGPIPAELGQITELKELKLDRNGLAGTIPPGLGSLARLSVLDLEFNNLSGLIPAALGSLGALEDLNLASNNLSGRVPGQLGSLTALQSLRLSRNKLSGRIPRELASLTNLTWLDLGGNMLNGAIPPELGRLHSLEQLSLGNNILWGPIPPELGNLEGLVHIFLGHNNLAGPIPPEFGNLERLTDIHLNNNNLTGLIPPEIGNLVRLRSLLLRNNGLTGSIPPEIGNLEDLVYIHLQDNNLTGPIPRELGNVESLVHIHLNNNNLTGLIPPELGNLESLVQLRLSVNTGLFGPLPVRLTNLQRLTTLRTQGTALCAPPDPGFLEWLEGLKDKRVALCVGAMAYLTQAVQSLEFPVPLIAGEDALLRVFVTAARATSVGIPPVRATFFVNDREVYATKIPAQAHSIPTNVDESSLSKSANARIPGRVVQPGLEMVLEVDPERMLDPTLGVSKRIPATGRLAQQVRRMPALDITLIPFLWDEDPDSAIVDLVDAMAAGPESHELLWDTRTLLPVGGLEVTAHASVMTSTNRSISLFHQTEAIRVLEGGQDHYLGIMSGLVTGARGFANAPGRASFAVPDARVMAHELGHNMSLLHAPCGNPRGLDPEFPQAGGTIGEWGYDSRGTGRLVNPGVPDLMSYCHPPWWISEYGFTKALRYRLTGEEAARAAPLSSPAKSLLLWGGINPGGDPFLEPSFLVDAPPVLPSSDGDYRLVGRTAAGDQLFSLDFPMPTIADGEGAGAFAFALPVQPGWAGVLASITLSGPGGSVTLDKDSDRSAAILLDTRRRQVRGILRELPEGVDTQAGVAAFLPSGGDLELLFSRGIPDAAEWRR